MDLYITAIIFIIDFKPLKSLATLSTLNALIILIDLRAFNAPFPLIKINSTNDKITIVPSM